MRIILLRRSRDALNVTQRGNNRQAIFFGVYFIADNQGPWPLFAGPRNPAGGETTFQPDPQGNRAAHSSDGTSGSPYYAMSQRGGGGKWGKAETQSDLPTRQLASRSAEGCRRNRLSEIFFSLRNHYLSLAPCRQNHSFAPALFALLLTSPNSPDLYGLPPNPRALFLIIAHRSLTIVTGPFTINRATGIFRGNLFSTKFADQIRSLFQQSK